MPMPRYFFVYVVIVDGRVESHVIGGDNWDTLIRTKAIVQNGVVISNLLYLSNVKEGTHHQRMARGEVPPQAKSPYRVSDIAHVANEDVCTQFINAGIGLTPDSVCSYCKGLASDHPDMEIPLSVMARVRMVPKCVAPGCKKTPVEGSSFCLPHKDAYGEMARADHRDLSAAAAPCEDAFQVDPETRARRLAEQQREAESSWRTGASGEAGPHLKLTGEMIEVDIRDPEYGVGAQSVEEERPGASDSPADLLEEDERAARIRNSC